MPTGHIMMAMSLDGFVARKDHALDWLMQIDTEGEDHGFLTFQESVDAIVMGSGSYRTVLGFDDWPYIKPVIVLSRSMRRNEIPSALRNKVEISQIEPADLMRELGGRGYSRIYVDGGAIIRSFLHEGLVDDMRIAIAPVLIGDGIRMFGEIPKDIELELQSVEQFSSGLVQLQYKVR